MAHLLVTNDFPPKVGGIQSYLWELWRRLPAERVTVLTTPYGPDPEAARRFDAAAPMRIVRTRQKWLLPTPLLRRQVLALAEEVGAAHVVLDPAVPVGGLGPSLTAQGLTYSVVLHGAEVTIPGRLPLLAPWLRSVLVHAHGVVSAGGYPLAEAIRCAKRPLPGVVIPPGVDTKRFVPLDAFARAETRREFGLPTESGPPVVFTASRHVPRKGIDTLIDACAAVAPEHPGLTVVVASRGRQTEALKRQAAAASRATGNAMDVRFVGRISDADLVRLYGAADLNATLCRTRWGGLEQEGFGIVFVEGAAAGVASIAGDSGGSGEAVTDGVTGALVPRPVDAAATVPVLRRLLSDRPALRSMGHAARSDAVSRFDYDMLAARLDAALLTLEAGNRLPQHDGESPW